MPAKNKKLDWVCLNCRSLQKRFDTAVEALTRCDGELYEDYLRCIAQNEIAHKVKIADIQHNLSGTPTQRNRMKYEAALQFLQPRG